ncbi:hypothetical protein AXF42_Ash018222 [Apostasia shenzhenica]|uniref:Integrase catalytic domain-containing protein n=1 Tax=Apostasia shenzhenica TaxID=1088818 RepID=A0A2I0B1E7_9ASPA|nr:hypothetical protein AXF42_Ash018222 [Apostasia shenzhenica]
MEYQLLLYQIEIQSLLLNFGRFWQKVHQIFGTKLKFSTTFHPQTDGQAERTIQTLEDLLRLCVLDFGGGWETYIPLIEFAYNNSYQSSIEMAPYEALYGRKYQSPLCWYEGESRAILGPQLVDEITEKIKFIREKLWTVQDRQKKYYDARHKKIEFEVGDQVFLKVSPMKGVVRFGKAGKLKPRYIGPFPIIERVGAVAYRLLLPFELEGIHDVFHISMLRKYVPHPAQVVQFDPKQMKIKPNLSYKEEPIRILARDVRRLRNKEIPMIKVLWSNQTEKEATWESENKMKKFYPDLFA